MTIGFASCWNTRSLIKLVTFRIGLSILFVPGELVGKASAATLAKNSCTVSVLHLREAVAKEKTFDFLQERNDF
jgi:uncharacterized membrane protein (Fun14 family)